MKLYRKFVYDSVSWIVLSVFLLIISGCARRTSGNDNDEGGSITRYSKLLSIYSRDGYEEVVVKDTKGKVAARYILTEEGKVPENLSDDAVVIKTPLKSIVLDSEVYAGALEELGAVDGITGVFDPDFVTLPVLKDRLTKNKTIGVGLTSSPNIEKILELSPDGLMISFFEGMQTQGLDKVYAPVIKMYDIQESTPLGRAEWIRLIGRLTGHKEKADSIFNSVERKYKELQASSKKFKNKPKILTETVYNGTWYVPGGQSYQSSLISDAGGNYPWKDDKSSGSLSLSLEQVLDKAHDADIWLVKTYGNELSVDELIKTDSRYREFAPVKNNSVYYTDTSKSGYFTEFPFHPELLLEDYISIFSGDKTNPLRYYRQAK